MNFKIIAYKGHIINYNIYNKKEYTIQIFGDELYFKTEKEAKDFIDSL